MKRILFIFVVLSLIFVSGCTNQIGPTIPYKKPPNMTVDINITAWINEEWNKTNGNTGITVNNSSIWAYSFKDNAYESFIFNTTDGKTYICNTSITSSNTSNMRDINGYPVDLYNPTITPYMF